MKVERGYKVELDPTNKQRSALVQHAGAARFTWNWGLAEWKRLYEAGERTDPMKLHKALNGLKKTDFPWMYTVSKCAPQEALRDLGRAFLGFFRGLKTGKHVGHPKFKAKGKKRESFRIASGTMRAGSSWVQLPNIGCVRLKERGYIPINQKIKSMTVSERAGRWYVSVKIDVEAPDPIPATGDIIGIDLGIKVLATCSDGTIYENPKALKHAKMKLRQLNKELSRRKKGSKNRQKTKYKLARVHARVADVRSNAIHKMTSEIVRAKRPSLVVIEDLNVKGMTRNHRLAGAVLDASFHEARRQFQYKGAWCGSVILLADRWFPSSKLCSRCGCIHDGLTLSDREFQCPACGYVIDRDLNAAINLKKYGELELPCTASSAGRACGDGNKTLSIREAAVREAGTRQKINQAAA